MVYEFEDIDEIKLESEIKGLIVELQARLGKPEIICIVYNPTREEGIKQRDLEFLTFLFSEKRYSCPLLVLSGLGGDFSAGVYMPFVILNAVKSYNVYTPSICGSALCYTIFKAGELLVGNNTKITQIDPKFDYEGKTYRAIKVMKDLTIEDEILKKMAKDIFKISEDTIKKLISSSPTVFNCKLEKPEDFGHLDDTIALLMNKGEHEDPITRKELKLLDVNFKHVDNPEADEAANKLIRSCQDYTVRKNVRVIFVSSIPIKLENEPEGTFICPIL